MDIILKKKNLINDDKICENNFFNDLCEIMNDKKFKVFFKKYFTNYDEINTVMMYLKIYEMIEYYYMKKFNKEIDIRTMKIILNYIIKNNILRNIIIKNYEKFKKTSDVMININ